MLQSSIMDPRQLSTLSFEQQLESLRPELLSYLQKRTGNRAEAEDLAQSALLRAVERRTQLDDPARLRAWVFTIARRALFDRTRRGGREQLTERGELPDSHLSVTPVLDDPACACALSLTETLAKGQAQLVKLVDIEENSLADAASALQTTKNAATVRLFRARQNLKDRLRHHCGVTDALSASRCSCDTASCVAAAHGAMTSTTP